MTRKQKVAQQEQPEPRTQVDRMVDELDALIRARYSIIAVTTWDVDLVMGALKSLAAQQDKFLLSWSATKLTQFEGEYPGPNGTTLTYQISDEGVMAYSDANNRIALGSLDEWGLFPPDVDAPSVGISTALRFRIPESLSKKLGQAPAAGQAGLFVLFGYEAFLNSADIKQLFWDATRELKTQRKTIILVSPIINLPPEIARLVTLVNWPLPTRPELEDKTREVADILSDKLVRPVSLNDGDYEVVAKALSGMTMLEAERSLMKVAVKTGGLDASDATLAVLRDHKKNLIAREGGALEYWDEIVQSDDIGGLDLLKEYILEAGAGLDERAAEFTGGANIASRGVFLGGVPGGGKSLIAKAIAGYMRLPLARLDFGKLFGPLLGQSEANQRQVFDIVEAISPCVLWLDELEKGNATGGGETDGGTSARLLGAFLTWSEEIVRSKQIFMVATANWVERVDAALQGRFSEKFFVDLPGPEARAAILRIHLAKMGRPDPEALGIDIPALVELTRGYVGREIQEAILSAMRHAYRDVLAGSATDLTHEHVYNALAATVPLSRQREADIRQMRVWGQSARQSSSEPFDGLHQETRTVRDSFTDAYKDLGRS